MALTDREKEIIEAWHCLLDQTVVIHCLSNDDPRSQEFRDFCRDFTALAPGVEAINRTISADALPGLMVGAAWIYHAVPRGLELEPFLSVLSAMHGTGISPEIPEALRRELAEVVGPLDLQVFIMPECPFCPNAIRELVPVPLVRTTSRVTITDAMLFPEQASQYGIKAVPNVILSESFRWTGQIRLSEILEVAKNVDPSGLGADALERMLKEGQAGRLAAMMLDRNTLFPNFLELLVHREWSVRLGAMVVAEELGEKNPDLARSMLMPLWQGLPDRDVSIRGDIVYLIGELGGREWAERLRSLLEREQDEELRSSIEDALTKCSA